MERKGFTLIELLAVIVILAIIALIATPIIMGVIEKSREGAFKTSGYGIVKSAELVYMNNALENGLVQEEEFTYNNYVESNENNLKLEYKGQKPQYGEITLMTDGSVKLWMWWSNFCATKGENESEVTVAPNVTSEDCGQASIPPTITFEGYANNITPEITIALGEALNLPNYSATNNKTEDITSDVQVTNEVDINVTGTYEVIYTVTDESNNTTTRKIIVRVYDPIPPNISGMSVTVTNVTENSFTVTRSGNATDTNLAVNPYTYQVSTDGTTWTSVKTLTSDTIAEVTGLNSGDTRYYRVCAVDTALNSNCSTNQSVTTLVILPPNAPELSIGMIPVRWNGSAWVKADTNTVWYNYTTKEWANAVLVTTASRSGYQSAAAGTVITENTILAHLVWIPRYRYQLFNVGAVASNPQLINIEFESNTTTKSNGTTNGSWLTHPAFTFGTGDGSEKQGIWVGKFETTGNATTPTVLPYTSTNTGITSLRSQNVSTQFATSQRFSNTTTYGLTSTNDAHMMKNTEWGAVAYLTNSQYGQGLTEVTINNSSTYNTGCAGNTVSEPSTSGCQNQYHTTAGVKASTTGNIYGIYDMSGGSYENVMGNNSGSLGSSGFTSLPDSKYYDSYTSGTTYNNQTAYNRRILGDATGETRGWNGDASNFVIANQPWQYRGGYHNETTAAGLLNFNVTNPAGYASVSFRLVVLGGS